MNIMLRCYNLLKFTLKVNELKLCSILFAESEKSFREILDEQDRKEEEDFYEPEELALQEMEKMGFPIEPEDEGTMEQKFHFFFFLKSSCFV